MVSAPLASQTNDVANGPATMVRITRARFVSFVR
jgi:hypothetical protein